MDYRTLSSLRPSDFSDAAKSYRSTSNMAEVNRERIERNIAAQLRSKVQGQAANAAQEQLKELAKNFHYIQVSCGLASTSFSALSSELTAAKKKLTNAVSEAQAEKFTVNADGSVTYPAAGEEVEGKIPEGGTTRGRAASDGSGKSLDPKGDADSAAKSLEEQAARLDPNPNSGRAQEYANRIATAVKEATESDQRWAPKLRKLLADDDLKVSHGDWVDTQQDRKLVNAAATDYLADIDSPPKDGTPAENSKWWKGLTKSEQDAYISLHPATVGAMDGLPADARDESNRAVLAQKQGQYEIELAAIPKEPAKYSGAGPATKEWNDWVYKHSERKEHLEGALHGMRKIQDRFDQTGIENLPEAYLLGFDPVGEGQGRVIIADGNPDKADHTAVYTPGTGAGLENINKEMDRANNLWKASSKEAPDSDVSVITWFDYNAPQTSAPAVQGDLLPEAQRGSYAEKGGPILRQFMEGADVAHREASGGPGHTTAVGHSYGSTVIAEAAKSGPPDAESIADDVIVAGSPGMQAKHVSDLNIPSDRMWSMAAPGDLVPSLGKAFTGLPEGWIVPTDEEFGGNIMTTDTNGHSDYWKRENGDESLSLRNQARVIIGEHDEVRIK